MSLSEQEIAVAKARIKHWQTHPLDWVKDIFGDNIKQKSSCKSTSTGLSTQQETALIGWGNLIAAKLKSANLPQARGSDADKKLRDKLFSQFTPQEQELSGRIGMSIMSGTGCFAPGTRVLMYDGSVKSVEDVNIDDLLMGDDSTSRKVLSLAHGTQPMYRIQYANGTYYDVNEQHKLVLKAGRRYPTLGLEVGDIWEVEVGDYLKLSDHIKSRNYIFKTAVEFSKQTSLDIPPYILGLWLGDGCFSAPELTTVDEELISEWKRYGESLGLQYKRRSNKAHRITSGNIGSRVKNIWMELLKKHNLFRNKHIPRAYLTASREDRLELLAGLIDTDGTKEKTNYYSIIQKDKALAEQILFLVQSLGIHGTLTKKSKSWTYNGIKKIGMYYQVGFGRNCQDIPCRLARKQPDKTLPSKDLNFKFTITPLGIGTYLGFELDGNHRFVGGDFSVLRNTGKDFTASLLIFHFLMCFDMPKLLCTANTQKQLKDVLWSECSKIMRLSKKLSPDDPMSITELQNMFEWQSELIFAKPYKGKEWFARACTINAQASPEAQGETLAGRHEDFQLFVLDEASSIPEAVWKPVEGTLTGRLNLVLCIFNPTRSSGFALRSQYEEKDKWLTYRWNSEESEIVDPKHIENLAKYGKDSNAYRIRVLGLPPLTDSNTLIPTDWIEDAIDRPFDPDQDTPIMAGIDVGGGGDKSIIAIRHGGQLLKLEANNSKDTMQVADWVAEILDSNNVTVGFVDIIGIGRGVYDRLRQMGYNVRPFDSRARAKEPDRFFNARAELFWKLREQFESKCISISNDRDLIDQLNSIKFYPDEKNKIEKKADIKKIVGHSPDQADALAISYAGNDYLFRRSRGKIGNKIDYTGVYLR